MKEPCGREWGPAVQRAARSRLGPAEADGFLARLELLSFDILEPLGRVDGWRRGARDRLGYAAGAGCAGGGGRAPGAAAAARPAPRDRSGLVPAVPDDRLCLPCRPVRRLAAGGPAAPGLPGGAGRHLPAPDAAAARGRQRRRLRRGGLRRAGSAGGTIADLEALAGDLHERGIAVCIGLVLNHTAAEHEWAAVGADEYVTSGPRGN